ncbi:hypothetical protein [Cellulomonas dongxiuzhuiae]|uniref:Uncharacterized protein n=1 Tax=Cellulomonas dongxiuzhuiae TaxID=2819979 RepID=A0ABX8GIG8_9CELL|nr:hypothetical protein [Cellulomonas dongxiuzhuiae]MBO3094424.1 hypothetical protein [Cellulomonas dongxiuzhuiae]QWC15451.1 hypothetical protein KKR89_14275 [Cellulomonas dongxiuzhuiae]
MTRRTAETASDIRRHGERELALALGLVRRTPPPVRVPSPAQRIVPGGSPLEASGWTEPSEQDRAHR